eukprot:766829-Hanusia_phi.AAC.2
MDHLSIPKQRCIKYQDDMNYILCLIILDIHPLALSFHDSLDDIRVLIQQRKRQQLIICNLEVDWDNQQPVPADKRYYETIRSCSADLQRQINDASAKLDTFLSVEEEAFSAWHHSNFNLSCGEVRSQMDRYYKNKYQLQRSLRYLALKYVLAKEATRKEGPVEQMAAELARCRTGCPMLHGEGDGDMRGKRSPSSLVAREVISCQPLAKQPRLATFDETRSLFLAAWELNQRSARPSSNKKLFYHQHYKSNFRAVFQKAGSLGSQVLETVDLSLRLHGDPRKAWKKWTYSSSSHGGSGRVSRGRGVEGAPDQ